MSSEPKIVAFPNVLMILAVAIAPAVAAAELVTTSWLGGDGNWNAAGNWTGSAVPNNGTPSGTTYAVTIDGQAGTASTVNLGGGDNFDQFTVDSLLLDAGDALTIGVRGRLTLKADSTINGQVKLTPIVTSSYMPYLYLDSGYGNPMTLGGSGTLAFDPGSSSDYAPGIVATGILTLESGLTIRGATGTVGGSSLINKATIVADVAGEVIAVNPGSITNSAGGVLRANGGKLEIGQYNSTLTNLGAIQAINDGTLMFLANFTPGDVVNFDASGGEVQIKGRISGAGQTLTLNATTNSWSMLGGELKQITLNTADGKKLFVERYSESSGLKSTLFDGVTVNGAVQLEPGGQATIRNGMTLDGTITLTGDYYYPDKKSTLDFDGDQTISGAGTIHVADEAMLIRVRGQTTIGPGVTVRGGGLSIGRISTNMGDLVNQGVIQADETSPYLHQSVINPSSVTNQAGGLMTVSGLADMKFETALANYGTIRAGDNGKIITGGSLNAGSSGSWHNYGTIELNNAHLQMGGTFRLADIGTITRTGTNRISVYGTLDLGGGTLTLDPTITGNWHMHGGAIRNGAINATGGAGLLFEVEVRYGNTIYGGTLADVALNIPLQIAGTQLTTVNTVYINDTVTLATNSYGTGSIKVSQWASNFQLLGDGEIVMAPDAGKTATVIFESGTGPNVIGADLVIRGANGSIQGNFTNKGTIKAEGGDRVFDVWGNYITNEGLIWADNNTTLKIRNSNTFTNAGELRMTNGGIIFIDNIFSSSKTVNVGSMTVDGTLQGDLIEFSCPPNGDMAIITLPSSGTIQSDVVFGDSTMLMGSGKVTGKSTFKAGSTLAPGFSPGVIELGGLLLEADSTTTVSIGGSLPGDGAGFHGQVLVSGQADLAGVLDLEIYGSFEPDPVDVFYILARTGGAGAFDSLGEGDSVVFDGYIGTITYQANWSGLTSTSSLTGGDDVAISDLRPVPEPYTMTLLAIGGAAVLLARRRLRKGRCVACS